MEKVLLEGGRDGGLAGSGETSQPKGEALLAIVAIALLAGETFVPGDVAVGSGVSFGGVNGGADRAEN